jgi:pimeloyl-ACP methyl ester carboxylesterase
VHRRRSILLLVFAPLVALRAQEMPHSIAEAQALERQDALPVTVLYSTSALDNSRPGDLLAQEVATNYSLPVSAAVRIAYHSRDVAGHEVVTTAVVLLPRGTVPAGGWPVIAWAHGTSGVAHQCAPSLMKDVYYGDEGLKEMLQSGFAVVATDYHGLGGPGAHPWVSKQSQAQDVIYSVAAARKAVSSLGHRWVADGHSQGGLAAWGVAELESTLDDPDYLGAISVAGALRLEAFMEFMDQSQGGLTMYLGYMAWALHTRFPEFRPQDLLTPQAMKLYGSITTEGCWYYGYAAFRHMPRQGVLQRSWRANPFVVRFAQENLQGEQRISKPLLVLAGEADMSVPIAGVRETVARACARGSALSFKSYPGLDHDPTMSHSMPDQLAWMRDRFAGKPAPSSCPRS